MGAGDSRAPDERSKDQGEDCQRTTPGAQLRKGPGMSQSCAQGNRCSPGFAWGEPNHSSAPVSPSSHLLLHHPLPPLTTPALSLALPHPTR